MRSSLKRLKEALFFGFCAALFAGCAGGGAGVATSPGSTLPQSGLTTQSVAMQATSKGNVAFAIAFTPKAKATPGKAPQHISPQYVSPSTQSLQILTDGANSVVVNLSPSSPNCKPNAGEPGSYICSASLSVPAGNHDFTVTAYDLPNAKGSVLSTNSTGDVYVKPTGTTTITLTLDGVVQYAVLTLAETEPQTGSPAEIGLTVVLEDADKNTIVGPATFEHPVTLTTTDAAVGPLSKTTLTSPADETGITVAYTGAEVKGITYSATATGLPAANVTAAMLTPQAPTINASDALGIYTTPSGTTYAFVPNANGVATVPLSNGTSLNAAAAKANAIVTSAFTPIQIPLSPAPSACTPDSADALLFCISYFNATVNVLDVSTLPAAPKVKATYLTDAAAGVDNSSAGCIVCGAVYDAKQKAVIYATGNGYELYSSPLSSTPNTHVKTIPVNVSENFGYDPTTDTVFSPEYRGYPSVTRSIDIIPFSKDAVFHLSPQPATLADPDAGAVDSSTGIGVSTEELAASTGGTNTAYLVNIRSPDLNTPATSFFTAPETTTSLSSSLFGDNLSVQCAVPVTNIGVDSKAHLAFFSGEFCGQSSSDPERAFGGSVTPIGVAALPTSASAPLAFGASIFANLPPLPDGTLWDDALDPHAIAAFNIPGCTDCGAIFNLEDTWIAVVNLPKLAAAPPSATDPHTVDPKYDLVGNGVVTYIPTGFTTTTAAAAARPHLRLRGAPRLVK
jgi:hypothetical protein